LQNRLSRSRGAEVVVEIQEFIADLCRELQGSLAGMRRVTVEAHADARPVHEPEAVAVGLIVNELVTNALKHAFPDNRAGKVEVIFRACDTGECELCVEDDGIGIERAQQSGEVHRGLGQKLIRSLVTQLQGNYEIRPRDDGSGTVAVVRFPAA
jgi:two-component sensor histidine kinase